MPLSDKEILAARERGDIVIEPFDQRQLGTDSYDVTIGRHYYREAPMEGSSFLRRCNLRDPNAVDMLWGLAQVSPDGVIQVKPGETILAHTNEFIGTRRNYTTKMFARSSAGRSMIGVCKCAGKGDVGFFNRWTMEITSFSRCTTIGIPVGMRLAQIEFLAVGETLRTYGVTHGKYQESGDLQVVMKAWEPEMMLPRFHEDWELK
jgi:dCTP deaminase